MSGMRFVGRVVSNRMQKTAVVAVDRVVWRPKLKVYEKRTTKLFAHDESQACDIGDTVKIEVCRRMSKHKHYQVLEIVRKVDVFSQERGAAAAAAREATCNEDAVAVAQQRLQEARQRLQALRQHYAKQLKGGAVLSSAGGAGDSSSSSSSGNSSSSSNAGDAAWTQQPQQAAPSDSIS